jgi:hypothetical protein
VRRICVVIGNGPSLRDVPDKLFRAYPTFGSNLIGMRMIPDHYVNVDWRNFDMEAKRARMEPWIAGAETAWLNGKWARYFERGNVRPIFVKASADKRKFQFDGTYFGNCGTVTFVMLEIAHWLGFEEVLVVGVDNDYMTERHFYSEQDAAPFPPGPTRQYHPEFVRRANEGYARARKAFEARGGRIVNLTPGASTDAFERGRLEDYVA